MPTLVSSMPMPRHASPSYSPLPSQICPPPPTYTTPLLSAAFSPLSINFTRDKFSSSRNAYYNKFIQNRNNVIANDIPETLPRAFMYTYMYNGSHLESKNVRKQFSELLRINLTMPLELNAQRHCPQHFPHGPVTLHRYFYRESRGGGTMHKIEMHFNHACMYILA
jgi:hypothetical protein